MGPVRKPFQGVWNVVRFNWPFYAWSLGIASLLLCFSRALSEPYRGCAAIAAALLIGAAVVSLLATFCIYDLSGLYQMHWAGECLPGACILNIHAGFDETSALLKERYPDSDLVVLDFFDPKRHTEASIRRARKACRPLPGTRSTSTADVPLPDHSADKILVTLSAHEIRDRDQRIAFFKELTRCLKPDGQIIVTEHLRDLQNFLAYSIGFFHFLSAASWHDTFCRAGLTICAKRKTTPFITTFILERHGTSS